MDTLKRYIESHILPLYDTFDAAHSRLHAESVISRSLLLASKLGVDQRMAYVIAAYHDVGLDMGRESHHLVSAERLLADSVLFQWFSSEEMHLMAEAIEDHRASNSYEPRSIYGKIVAEADRQIEVDSVIRRTVQYSLAHHPNLDRNGHFQRTLIHLREKYGEGGYLRLWLEETDNASELSKLRKLIKNESLLRSKFEKIYNAEQSVGTVSIIGSGRLATQLTKTLLASRVEIVAITSRNPDHAASLAKEVGCQFVESISLLPTTRFVIFAINDDAIESAVSQYCDTHASSLSKTILLHTSGSVPIEVIAQKTPNHGVLYPLQTFSAKRDVDFSKVHCFIEGSPSIIGEIRSLAEKLSQHVSIMDSSHRQRLHLAAVFACNFVNHMCDLASEIVQESGASFDSLLPLIEETVCKLADISPHDAQTGPAIRGDQKTVQRHLELLASLPQHQEIYKLLSHSIMQNSLKHNG